MEVAVQLHLEVRDTSGVGQARRCAAQLARDLLLDDTLRGRIELVVTEAATNIVKHAGGGELLMWPMPAQSTPGIAILSLDRGPGIGNMAAALRDGFSSAGTPGNGLGAMARVASVFDIYSQHGRGTAVFAEVSAGSASAVHGAVVFAGVNVAYPGESVSGDTWAVRQGAGQTSILVVDGLGHGVLAGEAAQVAVAAFLAGQALAPLEAVGRIHDALRPTRGAAVAVTLVDTGRQLVRFAGLGNIAGTIVMDGSTRSLVSHHGTAGHDARRFQEFQYPWTASALLVLHSDGLVSHWKLDTYPGLAERHPTLIAGILYRDFRRGRDDTTVVVFKEAD